MAAKIIKELETGGHAKACLVELEGKFYRVSSVIGFDTGKPETLVFNCDAAGAVDDWMDIAGGINKSRRDAIVDLEARVATKSLKTSSEAFSNYLEDGGDVNKAQAGILSAALGIDPGNLEVDDDFVK